MTENAATSRTILEALVRHADVILSIGRAKKEPLFVDALDAQSLSWRRHDGADVVPGRHLSNLASQQTFFRFLSALSSLTGKSTYRDAALEAAEFALERLADSQGLLFWGGHVAFDLETGRPVAGRKGPVHEIKACYPYYELLWDVDPVGGQRLVEAMWNAHVRDWSTLDFDRHGPFGRPLGPLWSSEYRGGPVGFWGEGLTFATAASDLWYAAGFLAHQTSHEGALEWAQRLAGRYVATRQGGVGLSAYQFSQKASAHCNGPAVRGDRARYQLSPAVGPEHVVLESTLFRPRPVVQRSLFRLGELLGARGTTFMRWAREEVEAWASTAYRAGDNVFVPMLTDGYSLDGLVLPCDGYFGARGDIVRGHSGDADFLWTYAMGWRLCSGEVLWRTSRALALALGFGDIGTPGGADRCLAVPPGEVDHHAVFAFLELYRATAAKPFLDLALALARRLLAEMSQHGLFCSGDVAVLSDPRPLSLLAVQAALQGRSDEVPPYIGSARDRRW